jgi:flagellin
VGNKKGRRAIMPQVISTNIASLNAQRALSTSQGDVQTSLQRLSSGLRINGAKDDAAGLAISERFTSQIRGLNQAVRNANDAISLSQTAEGSLNQTTSLLQRMRELAVQSANATNSSTDRTALQAEVVQLTAEVERIATTTQFNGLNLLDGTYTSQAFQVGSNANQTVGISLTSARSTALGSQTTATFANSAAQLGAVGTAAVTPVSGVAAQVLTYTVTPLGGTASTSTVSVAAGDSAETIKNKVNANVPNLNATASTGVVLNTAVNNQAGDTYVLEVNGQSITTGDLGGTATTAGTAIAAAIQAESSLANLTVANNGAGQLTITNTTGADISIKITGGTDGAGANNGFTVRGVLEDASFAGSNAVLTRAAGNGSVATGVLDYTTALPTTTTVNRNSSGGMSASANATLATSAASISTVDIGTNSGAQSAIAVIDAALATVSSDRADLGAIQNRFESIVANLATNSENQSAARSRIMDADFAVETASLTRGQILQQAGIAVLAQANAAPQNVLALLQ